MKTTLSIALVIAALPLIAAQEVFYIREGGEEFESAMREARKGARAAQCAVGNYMLISRDGRPANEEQGRLWIYRAATNGYIAAQVQMAHFAVPKDYVAALGWLQTPAQEGDAQAQFMLGSLNDEGQGRADNIIDNKTFGKIYWPHGYRINQPTNSGRPLRPNWVEARKWYLLAAAQGHVAAMNNLGVMTALGQATKADVVQAYRYFRLAGRKSEMHARANLEQLSKQMTDVQLQKAKALLKPELETIGLN